MELRTLKATDLFLMVNILNKIGIKNLKDVIDVEKVMEIRKAVAENNGDKSEIVAQLGIEVTMSLVGIIIEKLPMIEGDLYSFMGGIANMKAKEVANMEMGAFVDLLISIIQKDEFKDFFNRASRLVK